MNKLKTTALTAITLIALLAVSGCTKPDDTLKLLESQGMKDVSITGYEVFGCSEDDFYHTGFEATTQNGARVSGVVCVGVFFKGATIRYN
jgi:hypothetical protein